MEKHIGYIKNGINLDHIPAGNSWYILKLLGLDKSLTQVGIGLNLPSKKLGIKDLIKIENYTLKTTQIELIKIFCIGSSLSIIKEYEVVDKQIISLPPQVNDTLICPNTRCISHSHRSKFNTLLNHNQKITVLCYYCEQSFLLSTIKNFNLDTQ